jgi:uncharacterized protein (DUF2345 family)
LGDAGIDRGVRGWAIAVDDTGGFTYDGVHSCLGVRDCDRVVDASLRIQAVAANGPISLQAHMDQLEILADQALTIVSVNDVIEIKAEEKIVLHAGQ